MRPAGLMAAVWVAIMVWALAGDRVGAAPAMDAPAPSLILSGLDGETFDLARLRGKVVLVNYWATWCAPCRKEMPVFDAFYRRYHAQGFEMIGISIDFPRDADKMRKVAKTVSYPVAAASAITEDGFGTPRDVPVTYMIDVDGMVRDRFIAVPNRLLRDVVLPLLPHASGDSK